MSDTISNETIKHLEILSKLELSKEDKEKAKQSIEDILTCISKLKELDTKDIESMSHIFNIYNVFREDIVMNGNDRDNVIKNAPSQVDKSFKVPKIVD